MSESDEPTCPVCLDALIAPVTIPCGHNTCFQCSSVLNKKCPVCRASYTNECKINLIMDQLLAKIVPRYDERRREMMAESEITTLFNRYKKSTRYNVLLTAIDDQFDIEGKAALPFLLDLCKSNHLTPDPTEDEVLYLLHDLNIENSRSLVTLIIEGVQYYICCDRARTVTDFAVTNRQHLNQTDIYRLAASIDTRVATMLRALNLCEPEDIKWNREGLIKHLLSVQFQPFDSDSENNSDSDDSNSGLGTDTDTEHSDN